MSYSKSDVEKILNLINLSDIESINAADFDQFQYQGFDPLKFAAVLGKIKKDKKISDEDFRGDVIRMTAVGMIKGNVNDHNLTKMSDEGKTSIQTLISKYGIKKGGGKSQPSDVITFPRVMATFPSLAVRMTSILGGKEFSGGPMLSTRLPHYLQIQVFPSIIPRDIDPDCKKMLLIASLCYSIDQTIAISQMKEPDIKSVGSSQQNFIMIGHNSPVPDEDTRREIFKSLSLTTDYQRIVSVLQDYREKIDTTFVILSETEFKKRLK